MRDGTKCALGKQQCGFRQGRRCMDQEFAVMQVCETHTQQMGKI